MNNITNRQAICDILCERAASDRNITVLCSDSRGSGSMTPFAEKFPGQFIELGIAEQNLVSVAAGMAACGKKAFAVSPASFLTTRSYEQIKVDVAYSKTNVKLIGISGGVSYGALGMTHHSCQDIAALAALPGMRIYLPSDRFQTAALVSRLLQDDLPAYIRVSRTVSTDVYDDKERFILNKAKVLSEGEDVAIVACGEMVAAAAGAARLLAEKRISAGVIDMWCVKPIDSEAVVTAAKKAKLVVTVEEHSPYGGLGAMVNGIIVRECPQRTLNLSLPDDHIIAGSSKEIFSYYKLDAKGIAATVENVLK